MMRPARTGKEMKAILTALLSAAVFYAIISQPYAEQPTVVASWYGNECAGNRTANGEIYDPTKLTAAMWEWDGKPVPFNSLVRVTLGPKSVVVRINDRGPNKKLGRAIDLSRESFSRLACPSAGLINCKIEILRYGK